MSKAIREFATGAKRDIDTGKLDFEGFMSPLVLEAFGQYMNFNRQLPDGSRRDSDNWQKGIPLDAYVKSGWRHFFDWWCEHRSHPTAEGEVWALCGLLFNVQGYLHERLKADSAMLGAAVARAEARRQSARSSSARKPRRAKRQPPNSLSTAALAAADICPAIEPARRHALKG